ncbi:hypothetical protein GXW71_18655 [Roseomonas hellenica]|uniref:Uncharacterized protein n=1 Tax=Plastoroseomonas hellenica TaxID=2687306 RepID=A0ABS5F1G4_9PROT|nr:hypothetical protein [Plastoroseomonas hellenica]MBR0666388.1 hypothetical protein [Plastoroseomonas hellenica]
MAEGARRFLMSPAIDRAMREIGPDGNIVEAAPVWWWQLPDGALQSELRMVCARNALTVIAAGSRAPTVRVAIVDVLAAYALAMDRQPLARRHRGQIRLQTLLDWALVHPDRDLQKVAADLWREVLKHHRPEWEAEARRLMANWNDPASPLRDLRR